ncbi:MAG: exodeoxyribonuclease VII large subunit, partial [Anaerovoracaceae bacterium]
MFDRAINVTQLNSLVKRVLTTDSLLSNVFVIGEISNLTYHRSGHVYFSLKDENCLVRC